ncbi:MAG: EAL domain-containing protein, partial [Longicatena sp.]
GDENLEKKNTKKIVSIGIVITVLLMLSTSVLFLTKYVSNLLKSDAQINLTEIVNQNKDNITSKLNLEVNTLVTTGQQMVERSETLNETDFSKAFSTYVKDERYFFADEKGDTTFLTGKSFNVSSRKYFKLSKQGVQNISNRIISRADGNDCFVISVPIEENGKIIGTLQKIYTPEELYEICSISLFSSTGYMCIINQDGYILMSSQNNDTSQESKNFFRLIYAQGNNKEAAQIQADIKKNKAGFMETQQNDESIFSAYTPIEDIHDWYLISSVPTKTISPNGNKVVEIIHIGLSIITAALGIILLLFLHYKNKQQTILENMAFIDPLTKGRTLMKFKLDLEERLLNNQEVTYYLMKFDIDNFKYVNNFYGFAYGDYVLYEIFHRIDKQLSDIEMISRISSDNYVMLIEDASEERLKSMLHCMDNEKDLSLTFSAGLFEIRDRKASITSIVEKVRLAASKAKKNPQQRIEIYREDYDKQMMKDEQLKQAIKQAFIEHEFIPFYQPKVDVNTGKLVGAEALARWKNNKGEIISPNKFIPLCEETGLVLELDMIIFEEVLVFLKKQIQQGITCVPISVNFSRLHLLSSNFVDKIVEKVRFYEVEPELIEIEITENVMFENIEVVQGFIHQLHEEGFLVAMDDFGSGYSSLNMLKDIAIDILKIDRVFLFDSIDSNRQKIIFSAIIKMAKELHISIVVEGVETLEHIALMKEFGCNVAQGYYFAKPMNEESFEEVFKEKCV